MKALFQIIALTSFVGMVTAPQQGFAQNDEAESLQPLESVDVPLRPININQGDAAVLNEVRDYLNGIKSLTANFTQQGSNANIARGKLSFERPGKIRFEYSDDLPHLIVSDGTIVNFIDYEIGQITKWPVSDTPLALLLADEVNFNTHTKVSQSIGAAGVEMLSVTANDPKNPQQGSLSLIFTKNNKQGLELRAWQVIDAQGLLTTVSLSNLSFNNDISAENWSFVDPRGKRATRNRRR